MAEVERHKQLIPAGDNPVVNYKKAITITDDYKAVKRYQAKCKVIWIGGNKTNSNIISLDGKYLDRVLADSIIEIMKKKDKDTIICVGDRAKALATKMTDLQAIRDTMESTNRPIYDRNIEMNRELIMSKPGVIDLMDKHKDKIGVVAAAGPSLKYTYDWMKQNRDKIVIFSGGSSNIALRENGIIPDYQVMLDPFSMQEHKIASKDKWYGHAHPDTTILASYSAHYDSFAGHDNIRFWLSNFEKSIFDVTGFPNTAIFNVNISVSVNSLYFADFCGCKQIVICGQDCGKREGQDDHAWGNDGYFERNGQYRYIKGWDGEKTVQTELTYEELKDWIEYTIPTLRCKNVYNTSKDGAFIASCKNVPIEEVPI